VTGVSGPGPGPGQENGARARGEPPELRAAGPAEACRGLASAEGEFPGPLPGSRTLSGARASKIRRRKPPRSRTERQNSTFRSAEPPCKGDRRVPILRLICGIERHISFAFTLWRYLVRQDPPLLHSRFHLRRRRRADAGGGPCRDTPARSWLDVTVARATSAGGGRCRSHSRKPPDASSETVSRAAGRDLRKEPEPLAIALGLALIARLKAVPGGKAPDAFGDSACAFLFPAVTPPRSPAFCQLGGA
jgi:hypothetical protein